MSSIDKLVSIASEPLIAAPPTLEGEARRRAGGLAEGLLALLSKRNGFYAFSSALHVFPAGGAQGVTDLASWNDDALWRGEYGDLADDYLFFAEDIFGDQFCIGEGGIYTFDSETGEVEEIAADFEGWAQQVLEEDEVLTGWPLAEDWQEANGPLPAGHRLLPKTPFTLGGEFELENLYLLEAVKGMRLRGGLARQLEDLPEGAEVQWKIEE